MYLETIQTPHPKREQWPEELSMGLSEHLAQSGISEYLEQRTPSETETLLAASYIQQAVRRSLWYEAGTPLDALKSDQVTTCIGYTLLGSEAFDAAGIEHWIGFANGHAFLIVPASESLWMFDMLSPEMNQDISSAISYGTPETLANDVISKGRGAVKLHSEAMASTLGTSADALARSYPWVLVDTKRTAGDARNTSDSAERAYMHAKQSLIMSVFESSTGRDVIGAYANFHEALDGGKDRRALKALEALSGQYPDIDARSDSFKEIRKLVRRLSSGGNGDHAKRVVQQFFSSFAVSGDTRLTEYEGDCLRIIAETCHDPEAAQAALDRYESVKSNPRSFGCIAAKATITKALVANLA